MYLHQLKRRTPAWKEATAERMADIKARKFTTIKQVEAILAASPDVASYTANDGRGNPRIYYNWTGQEQKSNVVAVMFSVRKYDDQTTP